MRAILVIFLALVSGCGIDQSGREIFNYQEDGIRAESFKDRPERASGVSVEFSEKPDHGYVRNWGNLIVSTDSVYIHRTEDDEKTLR